MPDGVPQTLPALTETACLPFEYNQFPARDIGPMNEAAPDELKMNKIPAALLTLLALAACASNSTTWRKESALPDQVERDRIQCERQARINAPATGTPSLRGINAGVGSGVSDGLANAERQMGMASDCMRARGYSLR